MLGQGLLQQTTPTLHLTGVHLVTVRTFEQVSLGQLPRGGGKTGTEIDGELLGWAGIGVTAVGGSGGLDPRRCGWNVSGHNDLGARCPCARCPCAGTRSSATRRLQPRRGEIVAVGSVSVSDRAGVSVRADVDGVSVWRNVATGDDHGRRYIRRAVTGGNDAAGVDGGVVAEAEQRVPPPHEYPPHRPQHPHGQLANLVQAAVGHHHPTDDGDGRQHQCGRPGTEKPDERRRQQGPHVATRRLELSGGGTQARTAGGQMQQSGTGKRQQHATHNWPQRRRFLVGPPPQQQHPAHHHHRRHDVGQHANQQKQQRRQSPAQRSGQIAVQAQAGNCPHHSDGNTGHVSTMTVECIPHRSLPSPGRGSGLRSGLRSGLGSGCGPGCGSLARR